MVFFFAKNPPLYKSSNYFGTSVSISVIIFFILRFTARAGYCYQGLSSCAWCTEMGLVQPAGEASSELKAAGANYL